MIRFLIMYRLPRITESNPALLRELIWHERRVELALEGHRWFDVVRYTSVVPGYTESVLKNACNRTNFIFTKHSRFLILQSLISSSKGILTQNTAWK